MVLMRVLDVMLSFPWLVLLIAIITVLRPGLGSFYIAIGFGQCRLAVHHAGPAFVAELLDQGSGNVSHY